MDTPYYLKLENSVLCKRSRKSLVNTDIYTLPAELLTLSSTSGPFQKLGLFYNSCLRMRDKRVSTAPSE
jgi:hypothetical protein